MAVDGEASDLHYEWPVDHNLQKGAVYQGLHHSRLLSPATMMGTSYLQGLGLRLGRRQLEQVAMQKEEPTPDPAVGTGLGAAIAAAADKSRR